jgi:hypothetical protein
MSIRGILAAPTDALEVAGHVAKTVCLRPSLARQ